MKILITGAAGFIGFHLVESLLQEGYEVIGVDNIDPYYDISLKYGRLEVCGIQQNLIQEGKAIASNKYSKYQFYKLDIKNKEILLELFSKNNFDYVINLAAQAGVRYSITNPDSYIQSNVVGFLNILECCRAFKPKHLVYASSSSVYGLNSNAIFSTTDSVDHQVSLYAASKRSNELMAHVYSHLYDLPTTGLRFFTVYGPWGRPDMALFLFTKAIIKQEPIKVFNFGKMMRDFTYIDDIVWGIKNVMKNPPKGKLEEFQNDPNPAISSAPFALYNIGNSKPINLLSFIEVIEKELKIDAVKELLPIQPGDVFSTYANVDPLFKDFGYEPKTTIEYGVKSFIDWYKLYYKV